MLDRLFPDATPAQIAFYKCFTKYQYVKVDSTTWKHPIKVYVGNPYKDFDRNDNTLIILPYLDDEKLYHLGRRFVAVDEIFSLPEGLYQHLVNGMPELCLTQDIEGAYSLFSFSEYDDEPKISLTDLMPIIEKYEINRFIVLEDFSLSATKSKSPQALPIYFEVTIIPRLIEAIKNSSIKKYTIEQALIDTSHYTGKVILHPRRK